MLKMFFMILPQTEFCLHLKLKFNLTLHIKNKLVDCIYLYKYCPPEIHFTFQICSITNWILFTFENQINLTMHIQSGFEKSFFDKTSPLYRFFLLLNCSEPKSWFHFYVKTTIHLTMHNQNRYVVSIFQTNSSPMAQFSNAF